MHEKNATIRDRGSRNPRKHANYCSYAKDVVNVGKNKRMKCSQHCVIDEIFDTNAFGSSAKAY